MRLKRFRNFIKNKLYKVNNSVNRYKLSFNKTIYLFLAYFVIILIFSLILYSPITQNETFAGQKITPLNYLDVVFTTSSAFSDTGLVIADSYNQWNIFGQALIATLIFSGGIGVFALKIFIINWIFRKTKITLTDMNLMQSERGGSGFRNPTQVVITSVKFLIAVTIIFGFSLSFYFYFTDVKMTPGIKDYLGSNYISPKGSWSLAFRFGFFHTISALNNAGFDIMSSNSIMPYYGAVELQICMIILLIIGGIGYPVIFDIKLAIEHKIKGKKGRHRFSLFSKVTFVIYFLVFAIGTLLTFLLETTSKDPHTYWNKIYVPDELMAEYNQYLSDSSLVSSSQLQYYLNNGQMYGSVFQKSFGIVFINFSSRSAGFTSVVISDFSFPTVLLIGLEMIIGASPASTGGGIRTTTFALFIMAIISMFRSRKDITLFKRQISKENTEMTFKVIALSTILIIIGTFVLSTSHSLYGGKLNNINLTRIFFNVASAFGTSGLSAGGINELNVASKIMLIIIMFVGQFGISSTLLVWKRKKNKDSQFKYLEEELAIG